MVLALIEARSSNEDPTIRIKEAFYTGLRKVNSALKIHYPAINSLTRSSYQVGVLYIFRSALLVTDIVLKVDAGARVLPYANISIPEMGDITIGGTVSVQF